MDTTQYKGKNAFFLMVSIIALCSFLFQPAFDVNIMHASSVHSADGRIEVSIYGGNGPYDCYLYIGAPWKEGKLVEMKESISSSCTFKKLKTGKYIVIVEDEDKTPNFKEVELEVLK